MAGVGGELFQLVIRAFRGNEQIGVDPKNYTAEYNSEAMKQYEQVKKGNIAIIKHTDDGQTQIETPEEGAEFAVYLKSAGSYDNAKDSERDYLVCDENGFAQTKDLPYGRYTVQQIKGWEGRELLKPFDVFVSENGETYRYLINNANFFSYVKVVKVDSTTGSFPLLALSTEMNYADDNSAQYRYVMLVASTDFANDSFLTSGYGNRRILSSAARMMSTQRNIPEIDYKTFEDEPLTLDQETAKNLTIFITVFAPLIIIIVGLVVYLRRRHL